MKIATKRNTLANVKGLHLWRVSLSKATVSLWVLTRRYNPLAAMRKATVALERTRDEYPRSAIEGLAYNGTIDA
jgi:hypothetical protein